MKFAAIGDLHFDRRNLSAMFDDAYELQMRSIRKALSSAQEAGAEHVIFLGDIAHTPQLSNRASVSFLKLLHTYQRHFPIHIIAGNHDVENKYASSLYVLSHLSSMGLLSNTHVYVEREEALLGNILFEFLPHPEVHPSGKNRVVIGHFSRAGGVRDNGTTVPEGEGVASEKKGTGNLTVCGHLHTQCVVGDTYYPGTLYQTTFAEDLNKGWMMVEVTAGKKGKLSWDCEWIPQEPEFALLTREVGTKKELKNLIYELNQELPNQRWRVRYDSKNVSIPDNLMTSYPSIVECLPLVGGSTVEEIVEYGVEDMSHDVTAGLADWLSTREVPRKTVKTAVKEATTAKQKLGL